MKKIAILITALALTLASLQSQASIIKLSTNQINYNLGDTVLLNISLENINPDTAELRFNLNFDSSTLSFDFFDFSTDVLSTAFISEGDLSFFDNSIIEIFVLWFDSADLPATSFSLGQASFTAQQDYRSEFEVTDSYLADADGMDIDTLSVEVPAPAAGLLLLFSALILPVQRKLLATKK